MSYFFYNEFVLLANVVLISYCPELSPFNAFFKGYIIEEFLVVFLRACRSRLASLTRLSFGLFLYQRLYYWILSPLRKSECPLLQYELMLFVRLSLNE